MAVSTSNILNVYKSFLFLIRYMRVACRRFRNRKKKLIAPVPNTSAEQIVFRGISSELIKPKLDRVIADSYMEKVISYGIVVVS
jgi:hypothetical protein